MTKTLHWLCLLCGCALLFFALPHGASALTWEQVNSNGFSESAQRLVMAPSEFNGYLYVGVWNLTTGAQVWRTDNGTSWTKVADSGFGDTHNTYISDFEIFGDYLYAQVQNSTTGTEVWYTANGTDWSQANSDGFGSASNTSGSLNCQVFQGYLYCGTGNAATGGKLFRTDNGTRWSQVNTNGFGNLQNVIVYSLQEFDGSLYAGTYNVVGGTELWRSANGTDWARVMNGGFGDIHNADIEFLVKFDSRLFAGTFNGTTGIEVWSSPDGTTWTQSNSDGFGSNLNYWPGSQPMAVNGTLYVGIRNDSAGAGLWRTDDGTTWNAEVSGGFGDATNYAIYGATVWGDRMYLGVSSNTAGGGSGVKIYRSEKIGVFSIGTTTLPKAKTGSSYSTTLAAANGTASYAWSVPSGGLPAGLNLDSSTGRISGTPTRGGIKTFTVQATDYGTPMRTATRELSLAVLENNYLVTAPGAGLSPWIRVFTMKGKAEAKPDNLYAYSKTFLGGVNVATGDVNGDGRDEIITAPKSGGPQIRVFKKDGSSLGAGFWAFDRAFTGGVSVAAGDVDGDGRDEIIVGQASGGDLVRVFDFDASKAKLARAWHGYNSAHGGVRVAAGDVDGDGRDEIVLGTGPGSGPQIRVFEGTGQAAGIQFFAFTSSYRGGIDVAAGDVDGDGKAEIAASQLQGASLVKIFRCNSAHPVLGQVRPFSGSAIISADITLADVNGDAKADVVAIPDSNGGPQVRAFKYTGQALPTDFFAYDKNFRGGGAVALGNFF